MAITAISENSLRVVNPEPNRSHLANNVPVLSFFTGAGFLDLGFIKSGFRMLWHNEYNQSFVRGFEYGMASFFGSTRATSIQNTNSIIDISAHQIAAEAFVQGRRPDVFGMIGGPPCPDFSVGGKNKGKEGDHGKLSQVYVDRILEIKPTFFLFENVPGLLRTAKHRAFLLELIKHLSRDYLLDINILNALNHGVPQDRERVFMVGIEKTWANDRFGTRAVAHWNDDLTLTPLLLSARNVPHLLKHDTWFPWPKDDRYSNAKFRFNWPDQSPFGGDPERPFGIPEELMVGPLICDTEELATLPNGLEGFQAYSDKFLRIAEGDDSKKSFKRLHRWRYSPAAAYGNNEVHLHPTQPRRITVREALRIQTVPDTFALPAAMPLSHKFKTIGNGVPVKLAEAIAHSLARVLGGELA